MDLLLVSRKCIYALVNLVSVCIVQVIGCIWSTHKWWLTQCQSFVEGIITSLTWTKRNSGLQQITYFDENVTQFVFPSRWIRSRAHTGISKFTTYIIRKLLNRISIYITKVSAPSHYRNQCWLFISGVLYHSPWTNFSRSAQDIKLLNEFRNTIRKLLPSIKTHLSKINIYEFMLIKSPEKCLCIAVKFPVLSPTIWSEL